VRLSLEQNNFVAVGCDAELYHYQEDLILSF